MALSEVRTPIIVPPYNPQEAQELRDLRTASDREYRENLRQLGLFVNPIFSEIEDPLLGGESADPCIQRVKEGKHQGLYCYTTEIISPVISRELGIPTGRLNIPVLQSDNMVDWQRVEGYVDAMPKLPYWADPNASKTWAPYVVESAGGGADYTMYFAAFMDQKHGKGEHYIGVAQSDNPLGPFEDTGNIIWAGPSYQWIDPSRYDDEETGQKYIVAGSGSTYLIPLTDDGLQREKDAEPFCILPAGPPETELRLYEAPDMYSVRVDGHQRHILLTVGPDCFTQYITRAFYSDNGLKTPFRSVAELTGRPDNIVYQEDPATELTMRRLPGHHCRETDDLGQEWFLSHERQPYPQSARRIPETTAMSRKLHLAPMSRDEHGIPIIGNNGQIIDTPQPRPVFFKS